MNNIDARSKTVSQLLKDMKYGIDYYQREFKWEQKHIEELLTDLENKFLDSFDPSHPRERVEKYPHYFLGSIVTSQCDGKRLVIDGQQRLTSLSLLLIHLHHRAEGRSDVATMKELIFSEQYGKRSFNLDVPERTAIVEALFKGADFDATGQPESVQNILARYRDIQESFPDTLADGALPYFVDWLLHNVELVEITAFSDDDAYTIFETMNDRGLSLSPTDMLKGYLLAKSLHPQACENIPSFRSYIERSGLPFRPHLTEFHKADLDERQELYRKICEQIWNPARLLSEAQMAATGE